MDAEDEFELMYAEELDVLRELETASQPSQNTSKSEPGIKRLRDEDEEECAKKPRLEVVTRKLFSETSSSVPINSEVASDQIRTADDVSNTKPKKVLKRIPPGNFMPVTCPETKNRVYLRVRSENFIKPRFDPGVIKNLVSMPFYILRKQAEELRERSLTREYVVREEKVAGELWVEQFKPKNFIELLSDDGINRNLLKWLKLWDKAVFDRQPRTDIKRKEQRETTLKKVSNQVVEGLDPTGCPVQRLALLCGPPGLGKTTLAHVIANHAGYNVVELNASDDRSPEQFRRQIEASTQMRSVLDPRPNCLVIDEIDGAPAASINLLIASTTAKESTVRKDKRKNAPGGIRRPIICICNDQYVPPLRQLRQSAVVLSFPPIASTRLAFRLQDILNLQKYVLDLSTLLALCRKTENDVRSCLSTLQFVFGRSKSKFVTLSSVLSSAVGVKDAQKSHFGLWQDIFHSDFGEKKGTFDSRFHRMVRNAQANGDYDRLYQGVFENYLTVRNKHLDDICKVTSWFDFVDVIQAQTYQTQNFVLQSYQPLACAYFHLALSSNCPSKLEFPKAQAEVRNKTLACQNVLETLKQDQPPRVRSLSTRNSNLLQVLPFVSHILRPPLRPVNTRLLSVREREDLASLVDLMVSLNLSFVQKKTPDGQYSFELEPNLDDLVGFPNNNQNQLRNLTYAAKQLVSREIELEKVRRGEKTATGSKNELPTTVDASGKSVDVIAVDKSSKLVEQCPVDFFGRKVTKTTSSSPKTKESRAVGAGGADIWFRFKEGYSNAVRRNVRIVDLL